MKHRPPRTRAPLDAVGRYLLVQAAALRADAASIDNGAPDAVHSMRSTVRRLRSALAAFGAVRRTGGNDAGRQTVAALQRLTRLLAEAREAQVLHSRISALAGRLEGLDRVEAALAREEALAVALVRESVRDGRCTALAADIESLVARLPRLGRKAVRRHLKRQWAKLARLVGMAGHPGEGVETALHAVRKQARLIRYAAEAGASVAGERWVRRGTQAKEVQEVLGVHQDAVQAVRFARGLAGTLADEETVARLCAVEEERRREAEERFALLWEKIQPPKRK
ncbi:CHAD domain-containing protein [Pseudarthrobacter sp. P1]|uniref:CHAD domain-containing protein n=1 Tax=Pseudarthrobacter sp. P1 TaxID=3418418 RepID=UPI003CF5E008